MTYYPMNIQHMAYLQQVIASFTLLIARIKYQSFGMRNYLTPLLGIKHNTPVSLCHDLSHQFVHIRSLDIEKRKMGNIIIRYK